jgi:cytochrome P450
MTVLSDPRWEVPPLPAGDGGGMDRLRRSVSRFSTGGEHARRRAVIEVVLTGLDAAALRVAAREAALAAPDPPVIPWVPLTVLAAALGVPDPAAVAVLVPPVAAAYLPGSAEATPEADAAADQLLRRLGPARAAVLVQSCLPITAWVTTALDRGTSLDDVLATAPPVPATRRWKDGETVTVPLDGIPFGAGPRRCPGAAHARALADGVLDALRPDPGVAGASEVRRA